MYETHRESRGCKDSSSDDSGGDADLGAESSKVVSPEVTVSSKVAVADVLSNKAPLTGGSFVKIRFHSTALAFAISMTRPLIYSFFSDGGSF